MRLPLIAAIASTIAAPTLAQTDLTTLNVSVLIATCIEAQDAGQDTSGIAKELLSRGPVSLGAESEAKGAQCLESEYGTKFIFSNGQFESPERIARLAQIQAEIEAGKNRRNQEYLAAVIDACKDMYGTDRFRALTTPICGEVFKSGGLPD